MAYEKTGPGVSRPGWDGTALLSLGNFRAVLDGGWMDGERGRGLQCTWLATCWHRPNCQQPGRPPHAKVVSLLAGLGQVS